MAFWLVIHGIRDRRELELLGGGQECRLANDKINVDPLCVDDCHLSLTSYTHSWIQNPSSIHQLRGAEVRTRTFCRIVKGSLAFEADEDVPFGVYANGGRRLRLKRRRGDRPLAVEAPSIAVVVPEVISTGVNQVNRSAFIDVEGRVVCEGDKDRFSIGKALIPVH